LSKDATEAVAPLLAELTSEANPQKAGCAERADTFATVAGKYDIICPRGMVCESAAA